MASYLLKWQLLAWTAPFAGVILALKIGLLHGFGFEGYFEFSQIQIILTSGIFLTGFMLAGTLSDYKESERIQDVSLCC